MTSLECVLFVHSANFGCGARRLQQFLVRCAKVWVQWLHLVQASCRGRQREAVFGSWLVSAKLYSCDSAGQREAVFQRFPSVQALCLVEPTSAWDFAAQDDVDFEVQLGNAKNQATKP